MLKEWLFWVFGLGILWFCLGGGYCFGSRWLLEMDFWLFVDSWDFRNLTCIGEAVFWVFWWWFVDCLVVEEVVLALSVWGFGLEAMTDFGQSFKQQILTNNSNNNKSQWWKGKHTSYAAHIQISAQVNGWISLDRR